MAMTRVTLQLFKEHAHLFRRGGSLLEIGECNAYGDWQPSELIDPDERTCAMLRDAAERQDLFLLAKAAYRHLFAPSIVHAIDLHGTANAWQQDLNQPLTLPHQYDVVSNSGTLEHVFDICQAFRSIHDATAVGGYMVHDVPLLGWVDHGFFTIQPGLFYDLAYANQYELTSLHITHFQSNTIHRIESREHLHGMAGIPNNAMLFVVLRTTVDAPFRIPQQGIYDNRLSEQGRAAWHTRR